MSQINENEIKIKKYAHVVNELINKFHTDIRILKNKPSTREMQSIFDYLNSFYGFLNDLLTHCEVYGGFQLMSLIHLGKKINENWVVFQDTIYYLGSPSIPYFPSLVNVLKTNERTKDIESAIILSFLLSISKSNNHTEFRMSNNIIADRTAIYVGHVKKIMHELKDLGLIEYSKKPNKKYSLGEGLNVFYHQFLKMNLDAIFKMANDDEVLKFFK